MASSLITVITIMPYFFSITSFCVWPDAYEIQLSILLVHFDHMNIWDGSGEELYHQLRPSYKKISNEVQKVLANI